MWYLKILCLLLVSQFFSGCSHHASEYSYFNMLVSEKRTLKNKRVAESFWSSVRPVSTLSGSHYTLGNYYLRLEKYNKAIDEFSKSIWNDRNYCQAYNGIGMSYDGLKSCENAQKSYEQALRCDPEQAYIYNNYACSRLLCGDHEHALALLLEAVKLSHDNRRMQNNLQLAQNIVSKEKNGFTMVEGSEVSAQLSLTEPKALLILDDQSQLHQIPVQSDISAIKVEDKNISLNTEQTKVVNLQGVAKFILEDLEFTDLLVENMKKVFRQEGYESLQIDLKIPNLLAKQSKRIFPRNGVKNSIKASTEAIELINGNGIKGMAAKSAAYIRRYGFHVKIVTDAPHFGFHDTIIYYKKDQLQVAKGIATVMPGAQEIHKVESFNNSNIGVRVLLGRDLVKIKFPEEYFQYNSKILAKSHHLDGTSNVGNVYVIDQDNNALALW